MIERSTSSQSGIVISADLINQNRMVAIGGGIALLGCVLPVITGDSMNVLTIATKINSWLWLEPLSAGALIWLGSIRRPDSPPQLEATILALGSAWTSINLLAIMATSAVIQALGVFSGNAGVGIGLIFCLAGFALTAFAAFKTIRSYAITQP